MNSSNPLAEYASNETSQYGEDGLLAEIIRRIGVKSPICVEFGAWDGKYLSNTWSLWNQQGWQAVLIEGEAQRCADLKASLEGTENVQVVHAFVQSAGENSLDSILTRAGVSRTIDVLSIDVDGDEYYIWEGLQNHSARVVIIEFNPTIPPQINLVQQPGASLGASAGSLLRLAHAKNYKLAACTQTNCIFVCEKDFASLGFEEPSLDQIFPKACLTYIVSSYNGRSYITQSPVYQPGLAEFGALFLKDQILKECFSPKAVLPAPVAGENPLKPVHVSLLPIRNQPQSFLKRLLHKLFTTGMKVSGVRRFLDCREARRERDRKIREWEKGGRRVPIPHEIKQGILKQYARTSGIRVLVETGTYMGDMVEAMSRHFDRIYSIELSKEFFTNAVARFSSRPHIAIRHGDSAKVLPEILKEVSQPALFWLDGHYSAGNTAKGDLDTPIIAELTHIFSHPVKNHVILIDDARCFDGTNDYPTIEGLRAFILENRSHANFEVRDDVIRVIV